MSRSGTQGPSPDSARAVARERSGGYEDGALLSVLDRHLGASVHELDEAQIHDELAVNETALRRINARNAEFRDQLQWTPSGTEQALRTAGQLVGSPGTRGAFRDGTISSDHARVLADTLQHVDRPDRDTVEAELLAAARAQDWSPAPTRCRWAPAGHPQRLARHLACPGRARSALHRARVHRPAGTLPDRPPRRSLDRGCRRVLR